MFDQGDNERTEWTTYGCLGGAIIQEADYIFLEEPLVENVNNHNSEVPTFFML